MTLRQRLLNALWNPHFRYLLLLPFTLPFTLRRFFGSGPSPERAIEQLGVELKNREARFLSIVDKAVFGNQRNPYRRLFEHAGCSLGDLQNALELDGLDATLVSLARGGLAADCLQPCQISPSPLLSTRFTE